MTHHSAEHRTQAMNECIDNCTQCQAICLETINYCLTKGGEHAAPRHIALLASCADICGACAEVCRQCARDCEAMGDAEMKRCAEICRRCAESCAAMAAQ